MGNRHIVPENEFVNVYNEGNDQNLIPLEQQNQIIQERAATKKILAVRLPVYIKKQTLKLEQDSIIQGKYYIKFNYDSLVNVDCYINFNVSQKDQPMNMENNNHKLYYHPSQNLSNKGICIKNMPSGENVEFFRENVYIDLNSYFTNKIESANSYDICIELVPIFPPGSPELADNNEIIFVSLCNFENHKDDNLYDIKCNLQRLRTHDMWIDFHDIFDSGMEGGLCLICYSSVRNTIFLPCKHAACCDKCGSEIKFRFKPCPICKTPIDDLLIIDSDEKKFDGDIIDIENFDDNGDNGEIILPPALNQNEEDNNRIGNEDNLDDNNVNLLVNN